MQAEQNEQRQGSRRRVLKAAKIVYSNSAFVVDCVMRDVSDQGAKLKVDESVEIPSHFQLYLKADKIVYDCQRKWRKGSELGVEFIGEAKAIGSSGSSRIEQIARLSV
ncbi:PilZ domain-containing protein [Coralliovum pocilloporae]|uniref:PilZ domain-containing protein n=1 Tax=Coralliovum pocilloporae TaxID=3066369 RepID=UPI0033077C46